MIERLAHICFTTDAYAAMVDFYQRVLGLNLVFRFQLDDGREFGSYFDLGHRSFLEIFDRAGAAEQWGGSATPAATQGETRYQHFCLEVTGIESLATVLRQKGVEVTGIRVGMDRSKQAWIRDPDGNRIELMEYTPESWQLRQSQNPAPV